MKRSYCYKNAVLKASPFCDDRPDESDVSVLVVHNISLPPGQFGTKGVEQLFTGTLDPDEHPFYAEIAHLKVSAHCVIRRDGTVEQYVPFNKRAWHAGVSSFQGRQKCNDFAIGIELEGTDDLPYTDAQYAALEAVSAQIISLYPAITLGRIVGHNDIAPGRKSDPGVVFNWAGYRQALSKHLKR
ncbi:1,6-anhydro-N-acetylmuramyl-L-alanine amidase AmpD [Alteromonas lipolytica]|uniref:1,6-anhydro-N-acetylmuramyl-L-alanine amidase AmpD n=1 Tax=Alteromonas lipolytica TaxID=1856405 RepID=A0A1E8FDV9_9ALTE|nr:1,6-anhydro-N-acetylmuramyl-L-alanine amidase AmpD [Alteromonas lipolytica]OFI33946.1 N-acetyl-anhydromuranmyl-L-alanine amidase [Alteromonas lipolytica]GGF67017.1 N-acetyl-anhydromuranmyl-L-alanine amidase [Alteromonas lipolytica]